MKQGNQFYLDIQIQDDNGTILTNEAVEKIVFYLKDLEKTYSENSQEVIYDNNNKCFKIWLTEEETLQIVGAIDLDARILFKNDEILGCYIKQIYFNPTLAKDSIEEA